MLTLHKEENLKLKFCIIVLLFETVIEKGNATRLFKM